MKSGKLYQALALASMATLFGSAAQAQTTKTYTIPVVVHVIASSNNTVISSMTQTRIEAALARTNSLFQGTLTAGTLDGFGSLQGHGSIEFKLAKKTPTGAATTGIDYIINSNYATNAGNTIPSLTANYNWDSNKYLNIYVLESVFSGSSVTGVAYLPSSKANDNSYNAVLLHYKAVGGVGSTAQQPLWAKYEGVMAHEIGHSMNLKHTFGDSNNPGDSCGDDGISDTVITDGLYEDGTKTSTTHYTPAGMSGCGTSHYTNVENVMDYGRYQTMFTNGQITMVSNTLASATWGRNKLWSAQNLIDTGVNSGSTTPSPAVTLVSGVAQTVPAISVDGNKLYQIVLPAGKSSLTVTLSPGSGATGDADLYLKLGSAPSRTVYDRRSWSNTNTENVAVTSPAAGTYYIMVDSYGVATSGVTIKAVVQ
ncbi:M43 family zinc metalloprotease [Undibacterium flavidum]|uniref:Pre-peptidase C-terminal domain-containing protein n=1 Tax=Undibacterium flavidum TaxID=2762297 RepID=A0ABR6YBV5_9BURK|nr:M43 family zinc metalloprotease [Undibacterium flavidum]MBC3874067.1 pre-peptidase C-terminal domain-containing protein [Undibacterium flavidum]